MKNTQYVWSLNNCSLSIMLHFENINKYYLIAINKVKVPLIVKFVLHI